MDILQKAIEAERGVSRLADALGVRQNVVSNWKSRGLPKPWQKVLELKYDKQAPKRRKPTPAAVGA